MTQKNGQQDVLRDKPHDKAQNGTNGSPGGSSGGSSGQNAKLPPQSPPQAPPQAKETVAEAKKDDVDKGLSPAISAPAAGSAQPTANRTTVDRTQPASSNPVTDTDWQAKGEEFANAGKEQWDSLRQGVETGAKKLMQAAGQKGGEWAEFQDVREIQRWAALVGGGLLALFGLRRSLGSLSLMGIGVGFIYYAFTGQSPIKQLRKGGSGLGQGSIGTSTLDSNRPMTVKSILVKAPLAKVYATWADFENFPHFMQHIKSVTKTGERNSHWSMEGPLHTRLEWDAETTRLEENKRIAWSSTSGDLKTSGQVTFNALPDGHVEVTVVLRYVPPAGIAGDLFARLFDDPEGKLTEDLRNFKRYIENKE